MRLRTGWPVVGLSVIPFILVTSLLAACTAVTPVPAVPATPLPGFTSSVVPTDTVPVATSTPTPESTPTPFSPSLSAPPDGLRMAYIVKGNLHFQNGKNSPVQLTNSGEDHDPIFSDDGEKIAFLRGTIPAFIYSINVDGSGEQAIATTSQLLDLSKEYDSATGAFDLRFLPGTHQLLFRTYQVQENFPLYNDDLLIVDTDTAELKRLLAVGQGGSYYVSPNGRWIAIDAMGQINMIDQEGKSAGRGLLTYTISQPSFLPAGIFWSPNSTELTVLLPVPTVFEAGYIPDYTVWSYVASDGKTQLPLDPLPQDYYMAKVSPDGKWIIYNRNDQNAAYLGDLSTGQAELYEPDAYSFFYDWSWSPDSKHFVYSGSPGGLYLGSVKGPPTLIGPGDFIGWIDFDRYLYYAHNKIVMGTLEGTQEPILDAFESFKEKSIFTFILPKAGQG
jgi:Tol biopolymer transport system component